MNTTFTARLISAAAAIATTFVLFGAVTSLSAPELNPLLAQADTTTVVAVDHVAPTRR